MRIRYGQGKSVLEHKGMFAAGIRAVKTGLARSGSSLFGKWDRKEALDRKLLRHRQFQAVDLRNSKILVDAQ